MFHPLRILKILRRLTNRSCLRPSPYEANDLAGTAFCEDVRVTHQPGHDDVSDGVPSDILAKI